jgi:hypothetical protein
VWAIPIVLAVVLLVGFIVTLSHSGPRWTGTNSVPQRMQKIGLLKKGDEACQGSQFLPAGSGRMRMFVEPGFRGGTPQASMTIATARDGIVARSRGRYRPKGSLAVPLSAMDFKIDPPLRRTDVGGYVCIRNTGSKPFDITGVLTPFGQTVLNGRRHLDIALTALWFTPEDESWWQQLGAIIPRVGHARIGGVWAFWVASLLLVAAIGVALSTVIRERPR